MRKYLLLAIALFAAICSALAQTRTVRGVITDAQNQPLAGATVQVQHQTISTVTDENGKFSLNIPAARVELLVSYVGYQSQTLTVNRTETNLAIKLETGEGEMGEVVVTALGVKRDKRSIGYSIATVK